MRIKANKVRQVIESVDTEVERHSRLPTWYAMGKNDKCEKCKWEYKESDEVEVIKPKIGFTFTMHAHCFMEAVNEANNAQ